METVISKIKKGYRLISNKTDLLEVKGKDVIDCYKYMSNTEKHKHSSILMDIFNERGREIEIALGIRLIEPICSIIRFKGNPIGRIILGKEDILKPINEYLEDIKNSVKYKKFEK